MSNKSNNKIILLNEAKHWFALFAMFTFVSFSTGATHAAWQVSANIAGNSVTTGQWESEDADETIIITANTSAGENQPGWLFNRDASTQSPYEFNTDTFVIGSGALYVPPITNTVNSNSDKFIAELFLLEPIADFASISYDFNIAENTIADANQFYMNVYANFGESAPTKFYDCRYNVVPGSGIVGGWTTVTFDPTQSYPVATSGSSPHPCPASPSSMDALSASSTIRVIALNVGDTSGSDLGVSGYFDNVVLTKTAGTITYDFEPAPVEPPVSTETIVLNEIYPNRNVASSSPLNTEWVELYNGTDTEVDVNNWLVRVDTSSHRIDPSCSAAANKMAPMNGASTVIPVGGLLAVEFCNNGAFNKLPNGGANVLLSPAGVGNKVDEHEYPSTAVGKSHQRIPDGGIWVDPEPTPGEPNKVSRQDLIDSGLSDEQIETIELILLARGEYFVGEEPEDVDQDPTLDADTQGQTLEEDVKEVEESEEDLDEQSLNSTGGGGGGGNAPAETQEEDVKAEEEESVKIEEEDEEESDEEEQDTEDSTSDTDSQDQNLDTEEATEDVEEEESIEEVKEEEQEASTLTEGEDEVPTPDDTVNDVVDEPATEPEPEPEPATEPDSTSSPQAVLAVEPPPAPEVTEPAE